MEMMILALPKLSLGRKKQKFNTLTYTTVFYTALHHNCPTNNNNRTLTRFAFLSVISLEVWSHYFFHLSSFVMIICISIYTEMGYAWWPDICTPGDTYIERNHINIPEKCDSSVCSDWCSSECASIGRPVAKTNCQQPPPYLDCQCCCEAPKPAPCSPPSPSLPPSPPSPPPPPGNWPDESLNWRICAAGQEYEEIEHENLNDCALKPQCETKCKEKGLFSAGSQCVGSSRDYEGGDYSWFEQCCCSNTPPPPPPCSSCCGSCCPVDINIQISITQGSGGQPRIVTL